MAQEATPGGIRRRRFVRLVGGWLVAAHAAPARADLFGGDIGVLLAQLQQQLQLVSNAINTVRGIYSSVERLQNMVQQAKQLGSAVTGSGGLLGFLDAAQGLVGTAQGVIGNLQYIDVQGGAWRDLIVKQGGRLSFSQGLALTEAVVDFDRRMFSDAKRVARVYSDISRLTGNGLSASASAARDAEAAMGIVGQAKLLNRQMLQLAGISSQIVQGVGLTGQMQLDEMQRQAAQRQIRRSMLLKAYGRFGRGEKADPVDVRLVTEGDE